MLPKSKRAFFCEIGETITVTVTSDGTVHNVAFAKDDQDWDERSFEFTKPEPQPDPEDEFRSISLFMIFSNPNGGSYDIKIEGKPGEFVHQETFKQDTPNGTVPDGSRGYEFFEKV